MQFCVQVIDSIWKWLAYLQFLWYFLDGIRYGFKLSSTIWMGEIYIYRPINQEICQPCLSNIKHLHNSSLENLWWIKCLSAFCYKPAKGLLPPPPKNNTNDNNKW